MNNNILSAPQFPGTVGVMSGPIMRATYLSADGPTALFIVSGANRAAWTQLTINPMCELAADEIAIRNYGIHADVYNALVAAKIVAPAHRWHEQGYIRVPIVRLLVDVPPAPRARA